MRIQLTHTFKDIISLENLLSAWVEFVKGKRNKADVQVFGRNLIDNLITLHEDLFSKHYRHGPYQAFSISDPKPRNIHKASVRDRVLHHALYRNLYPSFDRTFIADSYSCREGKGTHAALARFRHFSRVVSHNHTRTGWVLKCDIRKFFASIDQHVLQGILSLYLPDPDILWLLGEVISSFTSTAPGKGLPLGNLTSQLLVNIYMNEFDQFVKHTLKAKQYIRYADDFVLFSADRSWLEQQTAHIEQFLGECLHLSLHPDKISIETVASGVDFLGWVHFPTHRVLRTTTQRRMFKRIRQHATFETLQSYLGLLQHGNTFKTRGGILDLYCSPQIPRCLQRE